MELFVFFIVIAVVFTVLANARNRARHPGQPPNRRSDDGAAWLPFAQPGGTDFDQQNLMHHHSAPAGASDQGSPSSGGADGGASSGASGGDAGGAAAGGCDGGGGGCG